MQAFICLSIVLLKSFALGQDDGVVAAAGAQEAFSTTTNIPGDLGIGLSGESGIIEPEATYKVQEKTPTQSTVSTAASTTASLLSLPKEIDNTSTSEGDRYSVTVTEVVKETTSRTEVSEQPTTTGVPEQTTTAEIPKQLTTNEVSEQSITVEVLEQTTTVEVPLAATTAEAPEDTTTAEIPQQTTSAEVPEQRTITDVPEETITADVSEKEASTVKFITDKVPDEKIEKVENTESLWKPAMDPLADLVFKEPPMVVENIKMPYYCEEMGNMYGLAPKSDCTEFCQAVPMDGTSMGHVGLFKCPKGTKFNSNLCVCLGIEFDFKCPYEDLEDSEINTNTKQFESSENGGTGSEGSGEMGSGDVGSGEVGSGDMGSGDEGSGAF